MEDDEDCANTSANFYAISNSLNDKHLLPLRSTFCLEREDVYTTGHLLVRRDDGIFSKIRRNKEKFCVLLKSGKLLLYSSPDSGISLNLADVELRKHMYTEKIIQLSDIRSRYTVTITKDGRKLNLLIKGNRSWVTRWRDGLLRANQGLPLNVPIIYFSPGSLATKSTFDRRGQTVAVRSLRNCAQANRSFPSFRSFQSYTLPHHREISLEKTMSESIVAPKRESERKLKRMPFRDLFHMDDEDRGELKEDVSGEEEEDLNTAVEPPTLPIAEQYSNDDFRDSGMCSPSSVTGVDKEPAPSTKKIDDCGTEESKEIKSCPKFDNNKLLHAQGDIPESGCSIVVSSSVETRITSSPEATFTINRPLHQTFIVVGPETSSFPTEATELVRHETEDGSEMDTVVSSSATHRPYTPNEIDFSSFGTTFTVERHEGFHESSDENGTILEESDDYEHNGTKDDVVTIPSRSVATCHHEANFAQLGATFTIEKSTESHDTDKTYDFDSGSSDADKNAISTPRSPVPPERPCTAPEKPKRAVVDCRTPMDDLPKLHADLLNWDGFAIPLEELVTDLSILSWEE